MIAYIMHKQATNQTFSLCNIYFSCHDCLHLGAQGKKTFLLFCTINIALPSLCDYSFAYDPVIISEKGLIIAFHHPVVYLGYFQSTEHLSLFTIMIQQ